jgi:hypothetical protein
MTIAELSSLQFANLVWILAEEVGLLGWTRPGFRASPTGSRRLLRSANNVPVVSIVVRGRPFDRVLEDLVDGVLAVNQALDPTLNMDVIDQGRRLLIERVTARSDSLDLQAA